MNKNKKYKIVFHNYYNTPVIESNSEKQIIKACKRYQKYNFTLLMLNIDEYIKADYERGYYAKDDCIVFA